MSTARIRRDRYGIAHITADNALDAFFAQGVAAAQDRLWQIDGDRRRASGRWAAVVGERAVAADAFARRTGIATAARRDYDALSDQARAATDAYIAGVNAHLATDPDLPPEYALVGATPEPFEAWESLAIYKIRHLFMGTFHRKMWRGAMLSRHGAPLVEMLLQRPGGERLIVPIGAELDEARDLADALAQGVTGIEAIPDDDGASNSWAVSGSRTASGRPIVAGDPHRGLDLPNVYWQNHISCPSFDVIGLSFPGVPGFPHFGHNQDVAWCITHAMCDDQDAFVEQFDGNRYLVGDDWVDAQVEPQTIDVAGGAAVDIDVVTTRHGGVVLGGPEMGVGIALRWTALSDVDTTFEALVPMLSAQTSDEFSTFMRFWVIPAQSLVTGDTMGTIAFQVRGRIAERPEANRYAPVPGWTDDHEWSGTVAYGELPRVRNPEEGFVVTANNRIADEPYIGLDHAGSTRARRIDELLRELDQATLDDMTAIHGDVFSRPALDFVGHLARAGAGSDGAAAALARLEAWNGELTADSGEAAIYWTVRWAFTTTVVEAFDIEARELGVFGRVSEPQTHARALNSAAVIALATDPDRWTAALRQALDDGVAWLGANHGDDPSAWRWGDLHRTAMYHPLARDRPDLAPQLPVPEVEMAGDGDTVRAAWVNPGMVGDYRMPAGSVARYLFDVGEWDNSGWVAPHGVSGDPRSPHWDDQLAAWAATEVELIPMWYSDEAVTENTISESEIEIPRA